jgi:transcriptional regulator with XRE-family HTH domain
MVNIVPNPLGEKIRQLRQAKRYTLEKLAELTDSSKSYIWELENRNPPRPSLEKISKIASVLGVTADFLIDAMQSTPNADVRDQAFFRRFRQMPEDTKERFRKMIELWDDDKK